MPRLAFNIGPLYRDGGLPVPLTGIHHYADSLLAALLLSDEEGLTVHPFAPLAAPDTLNASGESGVWAWWQVAQERGVTHPVGGAGSTKRAATPTLIARARERIGLWQTRHAAREYDLMHLVGPSYLPLSVYGNCPRVMTLYDVTTRTDADRHAPENIATWETYFAGAKTAHALIAISEYTRQQAVDHLGLAPEQITVTPLAPRLHTKRMTERAEMRVLLAPYGLDGRPFALYAGTLEPRKNVTGLIAAFADATRAGVSADVRLVLAGGHWPGYDQVVRSVAQNCGIADRVQMLGYVSTDLMNALMSACTVFAYLSHAEGFGIPPLEAMTCGAPVIVSNVTSLPEVVGDAGLQIAPNDIDAASDALRRLLTDTHLNEVQRKLSLSRSARFSWAATASATRLVYQKALSNSHR